MTKRYSFNIIFHLCWVLNSEHDMECSSTSESIESENSSNISKKLQKTQIEKIEIQYEECQKMIELQRNQNICYFKISDLESSMERSEKKILKLLNSKYSKFVKEFEKIENEKLPIIDNHIKIKIINRQIVDNIFIKSLDEGLLNAFQEQYLLLAENFISKLKDFTKKYFVIKGISSSISSDITKLTVQCDIFYHSNILEYIYEPFRAFIFENCIFVNESYLSFDENFNKFYNLILTKILLSYRFKDNKIKSADYKNDFIAVFKNDFAIFRDVLEKRRGKIFQIFRVEDQNIESERCDKIVIEISKILENKDDLGKQLEPRFLTDLQTKYVVLLKKIQYRHVQVLYIGSGYRYVKYYMIVDKFGLKKIFGQFFYYLPRKLLQNIN